MQMCRTPTGTLAVNHGVTSTYMFYCRNNLAGCVYKCAMRYHWSVMSTPQIPSDWALSITHTASEFVASQCFANIHNLPPVPTPPIDLITYMACCQLSRVLSQAYLNPSQSPKFSPQYKAGLWRTDHLSFHEGVDEQLTPGCINLSPCWFQQGHGVRQTYSPPSAPRHLSFTGSWTCRP
jgi:hypothetical protein